MTTEGGQQAQNPELQPAGPMGIAPVQPQYRRKWTQSPVAVDPPAASGAQPRADEQAGGGRGNGGPAAGSKAAASAKPAEKKSKRKLHKVVANTPPPLPPARVRAGASTP